MFGFSHFVLIELDIMCRVGCMNPWTCISQSVRYVPMASAYPNKMRLVSGRRFRVLPVYCTNSCERPPHVCSALPTRLQPLTDASLTCISALTRSSSWQLVDGLLRYLFAWLLWCINIELSISLPVLCLSVCLSLCLSAAESIIPEMVISSHDSHWRSPCSQRTTIQ